MKWAVMIIFSALLAFALSIDVKVLGPYSRKGYDRNFDRNSISPLEGKVRPISTLGLKKIRNLQDELCGDGTFTGVCLNTTECNARGGSTDGVCWNDDVCCKIIANCPSNTSPCVIRHSGTVVVNEVGNSDYRRTYRFVKGENICQLRLDFDEFEIGQPDVKGNCDTDFMQIISSRNVLLICGNNTHQHVYLEFDSRSYLDINMRIRTTGAKYSVRSSFIGCNSEKRVPINCLQYFAEFDGTVKSFNYGYQQLNNLEYSVCIEDYEGARSIQWKECSGHPFFISGSPQVGPMSSPICQRDWVQVYGRNSYCGRGFNTVTSTIKPFLLGVSFDEAEGITVSLPTDPSQNCNGDIFRDPYTGGYFKCENDGQIPPTCTCVFTPPADDENTPPFNPDSDIDVNNVGFCLDYVQAYIYSFFS